MNAILKQGLVGAQWIGQLYELSGQSRDTTWLTEAVSSVEFLHQNVLADDVVIYATLPHVYIHAVLVPLRKLRKIQASELRDNRVGTEECWQIVHEWGGGQPRDRVYLEAPMSNNSALKGGEKLVFSRSWPRSSGIQLEINQKLIHVLDVHLVEERGTYCRIDELGDMEDVIKVIHEQDDGSGKLIHAVSIKRQDFFEYVALADMGILFFFDFNRYRPGDPNIWSNVERSEHTDPLLSYYIGVQPGAGSYAQGCQIFIPPISRHQIVQRYQQGKNPQQEYATFKAVDLKTRDLIQTSCHPAQLSSYFEPESDLPLQMSPVFFNAEVLHKYKADPTKYELTDRSILCKGAWHLTTYDVNEAGQVHTYISYLGDLPYQEQLYWQSFNEKPKGPPSRRSVLNDFLGEFADCDPLQALKYQINLLDQHPPSWWNPRGYKMALAVQMPVTGAEEEWSNALLSLDQFLVEGLNHKELKKIVATMGRPVEEDWKSIKLMEECLIGEGVAEKQAKEVMGALRSVHNLRTVVKGHAMGDKKTKTVKQILNDYSSFRHHFESLVAECSSALHLITEKMSIAVK